MLARSSSSVSSSGRTQIDLCPTSGHLGLPRALCDRVHERARAKTCHDGHIEERAQLPGLFSRARDRLHQSLIRATPMCRSACCAGRKRARTRSSPIPKRASSLRRRFRCPTSRWRIQYFPGLPLPAQGSKLIFGRCSKSTRVQQPNTRNTSSREAQQVPSSGQRIRWDLSC